MSHRHSPSRPGRGATPAPALVPLAALAIGLWGCTPTVKVQPPDQPIEINMNVRIEQEVRVTVARDLEEAFQANPALFGVPPEINAPPAAERATTFEALRPPEELAPEIGRFQRPFTERDLYSEGGGDAMGGGGADGARGRPLPPGGGGAGGDENTLPDAYWSDDDGAPLGHETDEVGGQDLDTPRSRMPGSDFDRPEFDDDPL